MNTIPDVLLPAERAPVLEEADVVVVGGGTSGFIAAVAAARTGARTVLIERFGYLGGCTTTPYNTTPGWFSDAAGNRVVRGIAWDFIERMRSEGECFLLDELRHQPQIWPPTTKKIALEMIEEVGVSLYFYAWAQGVIPSDQAAGAIGGIVVQTKRGRGVILGKAFVDASGDADVAAFAGAPFEMADLEDLQQVSLDLTACGVDAARVAAWAREHEGELEKVRGLQYDHRDAGAQPMLSFVIPGELSSSDAEGKEHHIGVMPTVKLCVYREAVRLQGNTEIDPLDPKALTYAEAEGIRGAYRHLAYLRKNVPGFEHAFVVAQNHLGIRESRRIVGEYSLSVEEVRGGARFNDVVALNSRGLDYHLKGTVFRYERLRGSHDIPLRALLPKTVPNLIVAGRSISCDHLAQASLRGAATSMATGHAAGTAAAMAALGHGGVLRDLEIGRLQAKLRDQDALLEDEPDI